MVDVDPAQGLSREQVRDRVTRGLANTQVENPSRTTGEIVRANVVTRFNILLGPARRDPGCRPGHPRMPCSASCWSPTPPSASSRNCAPKKTLDRLALLTAPKVRVVRDGNIARRSTSRRSSSTTSSSCAPAIKSPSTGRVIAARGLEINESLLTGESDPVAQGDRRCGALRQLRRRRQRSLPGHPSRRQTPTRPPWRRKPSGSPWSDRSSATASTGSSAACQLGRRSGDHPADLEFAAAGGRQPIDAIRPSSPLVGSRGRRRHDPAGPGAADVHRLRRRRRSGSGRRNVLVQELPAIEGLARVDTVCFDKTGTLTEGTLVVQDISAARRT